MFLRKKKKRVDNYSYTPMSDREMDEALATGSSLPIWEAVMTFIDKKIAECVADGIREDNEKRDWTDGRTSVLYELQGELKAAAGSASQRYMLARRKERQREIREEARQEFLQEQQKKKAEEDKIKSVEKARLSAIEAVRVEGSDSGDS